MDGSQLPAPSSATTAGVKRKRGRPPKNPASGPAYKKWEKEKLCFLCFEDGGQLVPCGRRDCSKVYHPECVGRDDEYFRQKGRWNCGWHICTICQKASHYMCYTCTYSLCKGCSGKAEFVCVRGYKGLCETCMTTVRLIEVEEHANDKTIEENFDDKNGFDYLFKLYWLDLKEKLALTFGELIMAKSQRKESAVLTCNEESSDKSYDAIGGHGSSLESLLEYDAGRFSSRNSGKKCSRSTAGEETLVEEAYAMMPNTNWASKELLEFVAHMRDGDRSILTHYDCQDLLLEYINQKNLRDPDSRSQIMCDQRLQKIFGKSQVGHFEMLKLLDSHFLIKEDTQVAMDDKQGGVVDTDFSQVDPEGYAVTVLSSDNRRKIRKTVEREPQTNLNDYAAVDGHNINLIYLRRSLMECLLKLEDIDKFNEQVVGSFVRIRTLGVGHRNEIYRLVQVIGTRKVAEHYKIGNKMTDIKLEIVNLDKKELIPIDNISNQEFTEDELERLRQSMLCGFISRLTVGEILEKARVLQGVKVNIWLESEKLRIAHLRDRASERGHRKELRLCVEKLQLLSMPEEQKRRLHEVQEVHVDPKMDPSYESLEEEEPDDKQDNFTGLRGISPSKKREIISPGQGTSLPSYNWNSTQKNSNTMWESNSSLQEGGADDRAGELSCQQHKDVFQRNSLEAPDTQTTFMSWEAGGQDNHQPAGSSVRLYDVAPETTSAPLSVDVVLPLNASEIEMIWHYKDPAGRVQGPFTMVQLHEWSTTGYFPPDLRIWRTFEKQEDSMLLTVALQDHRTSGSERQQCRVVQSNDLDLLGADDNDHRTSGSERQQHWVVRSNDLDLLGAHDTSAVETMIDTKNSSNLRYLQSDGPNNVASVLGLEDKLVSSDSCTINTDSNLVSNEAPFSITKLTGESSLPESFPHSKPVCELHGQAASSLQEHASGGSNVGPFLPPESEMEHNQIKKLISGVKNLEDPLGGQSRKWDVGADYAKWKDPLAMMSNKHSVPSAATKPSGWDVHADNSEQENIPKAGWRKRVQGKSNTNCGWEATSHVKTSTIKGWEAKGKQNSSSNTGWEKPTVVDRKATGWETPIEENVIASKGWETPSQENTKAKTGWEAPKQGNTNTSAVWGTPAPGTTNASTRWEILAPGNTDASSAWGTPAAGKTTRATTSWDTAASGDTNVSTGWGTWEQVSGKAVWGAPAHDKTQNSGWDAASRETSNPSKKSSNAETGWGTALEGNVDWDTKRWGTQSNHNGNRHCGQRERDLDGKGGGSGRDSQRYAWDRARPGSKGGSSQTPREQKGRTRVCKFYESGYCRRGTSCHYKHS